MDDVSVLRFTEFCEFKKEIRGSTKYLIVGVDIAKERHNAFFGTATGRTLHKGLVFDNTCEGFRKLLAQVDMLSVQHNLQKVVFGMEPTANYHKPLAEHLMKCGLMVVLVAPSATTSNRTLLDGRWDKHDVKDSANIADLVAQGKCLYYECPGMELKGLRGLLSLKRRLKKEEHGLRVRIRNQLLAQYFPEIDRHFDSSASLAVVERCLDPSVIAGMDYEEFRRTVVPGRVNIAQQRQLRTLWQAAPQSIGCDASEAVSFEARVMVLKLQHVRETIKAVQDKVEDICWQFPEYAYLLTIPGIGPDVASKILGAIGNPHRFTSASQVLKMAGLDLCADRSGKTSARATPVLSKRGKSDLRYGLYQAAMVASLRNRDFIIYYTTELLSRGREKGISTKIRVKLAAKLLVIAWTLMKNREVFNPKCFNKEEKQQRDA